jgi:hypothetical protein
MYPAENSSTRRVRDSRHGESLRNPVMTRLTRTVAASDARLLCAGVRRGDRELREAVNDALDVGD